MMKLYHFQKEKPAKARPRYDDHIVRLLCVAFIVGVFVGIFLGASPVADASHRQPIPTCAEDHSLLVGKGDFGHGQYEYYECLRPEDITREAKLDAGIGAGLAEAICEHKRYWKRQHGIGPLVSEACHDN